jgi:hypothetical protein
MQFPGIPRDQGLFLSPGPALDLVLPAHGGDFGLGWFRVNQLHGSVLTCISGALPLIVCSYSFLNICGVAYVIGAIGAFQNVDMVSFGGGRHTKSIRMY